MMIKRAVMVVLALLAAACVSTGTGPVRITADPDGVSVDRPLRIVVDGLADGEPARMWARIVDREGQQWQSSGEFTADGEGRVDTTASAGGTYGGVDPNGLFWSMHLPSVLRQKFVGRSSRVIRESPWRFWSR